LSFAIYLFTRRHLRRIFSVLWQSQCLVLYETSYNMHTCIQQHAFNGHFAGQPGYSVSILDFIGAKGNGGGVDNWSSKSCKATVKSSPPTNQHNFLQAGCPSCRPANSVKALKGESITLHGLALFQLTCRSSNLFFDHWRLLATLGEGCQVSCSPSDASIPNSLEPRIEYCHRRKMGRSSLGVLPWKSSGLSLLI